MPVNIAETLPLNQDLVDKALDQPRLYHELSYLWPIISPPQEYAEEAESWRRVLKDRLGRTRRDILELGSGGGHLLSHLTNDFQATAVDLSPPMLHLSRQLNPNVQHHLGDMRTVRLDRTFDAVLIHDAVGHMLTEADLRAAFTTARHHLRPGGLLLVAPEWVKEQFEGPKLFLWKRTGKRAQSGRDLRISVTIQEYVHDPDHTDSQTESIYSYMIQSEGGVAIEGDVHLNGLFPGSTWTRMLAETGFRAERVELPGNEGGYGRNMFIGTLPVG